MYPMTYNDIIYIMYTFSSYSKTLEYRPVSACLGNIEVAIIFMQCNFRLFILRISYTHSSWHYYCRWLSVFFFKVHVGFDIANFLRNMKTTAEFSFMNLSRSHS